MFYPSPRQVASESATKISRTARDVPRREIARKTNQDIQRLISACVSKFGVVPASMGVGGSAILEQSDGQLDRLRQMSTAIVW